MGLQSLVIIIACLALQPVWSHSWLFDTALLAGRAGTDMTQHDYDLTNSVSAGAHIAIAECAYQFKFETWNCPAEAFHISKPRTTPTLPPKSMSVSKLERNTYKVPRSSSRRRKDISTANSRLNMPEPSPNHFKHDHHHQEPKATGKVRTKMPSNRETAFIHAITSAGITHTLTRNCSLGDFSDCGCDTKLTRRQYGWKWGGCSDNINFGSQVAKEFMDSMETGHDKISVANLHNNEAGRVAVRKKMRRICKCHGVSGSCTTQTCWSTLSDFKVVGTFLKKMYKQAAQVDYDFEEGKLDMMDNLMRRKLEADHHNEAKDAQDSGEPRSKRKVVRLNGIRRSRSNRGGLDKDHQQTRLLRNRPVRNTAPVKGQRRRGLRSRRKNNKNRKQRRNQSKAKKGSSTLVESGRLNRHKRKPDRIKKRTLVFLEQSPDYCSGNPDSGVQSVLDRKCITEPEKPKSRATVQACSKMCQECGYKVVEKAVEVLVPCNCRFKWCCNVTCDTCKVQRIEVTCAQKTADDLWLERSAALEKKRTPEKRDSFEQISSNSRAESLADKEAFSRALISAFQERQKALKVLQ